MTGKLTETIEQARRAAEEWRIPTNADGTGELAPPKDDCVWGYEQGYLAALSRPNASEQVAPTTGNWNGFGKYGSSLSFEGGCLHINQAGCGAEDGNGSFAFKDEDLGFEKDDGPLYRTLDIANSELIALRDHLNKIFPPVPTPSDAIGEMRARGWSVAVHNDYRLQGSPHTFWLWTHPDGRWIKGEGRTDADALAQCLTSGDGPSAPPQGS